CRCLLPAPGLALWAEVLTLESVLRFATIIPLEGFLSLRVRWSWSVVLLGLVAAVCVGQEQPAPGQAPQNEAPQTQTPQTQTPQNQAPQNQAPRGQAAKKQSPQNLAPPNQSLMT